MGENAVIINCRDLYLKVCGEINCVNLQAKQKWKKIIINCEKLNNLLKI